MPELPDIITYLDALRPRVIGERIERVQILSPFLVRSFEPPIESINSLRVRELRRLGKRIVLGLDNQLFLVLHLMIAGRLRWMKRNAKSGGRIVLTSLDFPDGTLLVTEAGSKKRASLHLVSGETSLAEHHPGGLDVLETDEAAFIAALRRENHTLKRALTDPHLFDGIGNAYSDEILHAARLSPLTWTSRLNDIQAGRLFKAARGTLTHWIAELKKTFADHFPGPGEITAFRDEFVVHGKFGKPCAFCGTLVQRIRYADNETNYCPTCQTQGRVLADRSLSRILKEDWPRSVEELG